jgi:hypothetical protein
MTRMIIAVLALGVAGGGAVSAAPPEGALAGAAAGAALGWYVGHKSHRIHSRDAALALGATGAIIGHSVERHSRGARKVDEDMPAVRSPDASVVADPHPGVDLVKISILHRNGVRTDVSLLRVGDRFVGPQGETYETLPSAAVLASRYGL